MCIFSAVCVCCSADVKKSPWNGTVCHKMQCFRTGSHATLQLHGNGSLVYISDMRECITL